VGKEYFPRGSLGCLEKKDGQGDQKSEEAHPQLDFQGQGSESQQDICGEEYREKNGRRDGNPFSQIRMRKVSIKIHAISFGYKSYMSPLGFINRITKIPLGKPSPPCGPG
jgi:hypothetical protein